MLNLLFYIHSNSSLSLCYDKAQKIWELNVELKCSECRALQRDNMLTPATSCTKNISWPGLTFNHNLRYEEETLSQFSYRVWPKLNRQENKYW